eukprot:m.87997 g.87997  ORF g.87997 m.87997 type:complete len:56 (+) comp26143_c0_seq1:1208-1375(+)
MVCKPCAKVEVLPMSPLSSAWDLLTPSCDHTTSRRDHMISMCDRILSKGLELFDL